VREGPAEAQSSRQRGAYRRRVAKVVGRYDGFVAKYMGDGVPVRTIQSVFTRHIPEDVSASLF
jgi:hypothetical protein